MCSEYGQLATLTVCIERTIRQLPLTVRNSATVLDMIGKCQALLPVSPVIEDTSRVVLRYY